MKLLNLLSHPPKPKEMKKRLSITKQSTYKTFDDMASLEDKVAFEPLNAMNMNKSKF